MPDSDAEGGRVKRISDKKLAKLGGKVPFSTISSKPKRIRKRPRKPSETLRIYGGKKRIEFVKSLPCAACGVVGYSENAHAAPPSEKGTGYKAGFQWIVPLCGRRNALTFDRERDPYIGYIGCHASLHFFGPEAFNRRFPAFDPLKAAAETEKLWQESQR